MWKDGEVRGSRIVFIGKDLDQEKLEKGFRKCAAKAPTAP